MSVQFTITDYFQLLTLHRALMEAKFNSLPNDRDIAGSSLLADLANQVVMTLIQKEIERGQPAKAKQWETWRIIDEARREWQVALQYVKNITHSWPDWTQSEKENYVRILFSPFTLSDELISRFVSEVDNKR